MRADAARRAGSQWKLFAARCRWIVAIVAIAVMATGSVAFRLADGSGSGQGMTMTRNGEIRLQGTITQDTCYIARTAWHAPIGDVGCGIVVNGYVVDVIQGNTVPVGKPGEVTGLDISRDQVGRPAAVFARLTGPHSASVLFAPKYYVRISR